MHDGLVSISHAGSQDLIKLSVLISLEHLPKGTCYGCTPGMISLYPKYRGTDIREDEF